MPNNMIFLMQNTLNNSSGTNNYFSGTEVYWAKGKGSNIAGQANTLSAVSLADLNQQLIDCRADQEAQQRAHDVLLELINLINAEIMRIDLEILLERTTSVSYCVSRIENFVTSWSINMSAVGACGVCPGSCDADPLAPQIPGQGCNTGISGYAYMIVQGQGSCAESPDSVIDADGLRSRNGYLARLMLKLKQETTNLIASTEKKFRLLMLEQEILKKRNIIWDEDNPSDEGYGGGIF